LVKRPAGIGSAGPLGLGSRWPVPRRAVSPGGRTRPIGRSAHPNPATWARSVQRV